MNSTAFAVHERVATVAILRETWGHLAPAKNTSYRGRIVFAADAYDGSIAVISAELSGLDDSPWFYDAMMDFLREFDPPHGRVFEWRGTFRNYHFHGRPRELSLGAQP